MARTIPTQEACNRRLSESQLRKHGVAAVSDGFRPELIGALAADFFKRFGGLSEAELERDALRVGHERYMLTPELTGAFGEAELLAAAWAVPILSSVLGADFILNSVSVVVAYPGAREQHAHTDHPELFGTTARLSRLPPHAVTLVVPLVKLDDALRGTWVWPGSHRRSPRYCRRSELRPPLGGAGLVDYRLHHAGAPMRAQVPRPMLYLVYSRPWFRDAVNFARLRPLNLPGDFSKRADPALRKLLSHLETPELKPPP